MIKLRTHILLTFSLTLTFGLSLFGQDSGWIREIQARFEPGDSIHWTTEYKGRWADFHEIKMILSFNGSELHGKIKYQSSNEVFELDGLLSSEGQTTLYETDRLGRQTAFIQGVATDTRIEANWYNATGTQNLPFRAIAKSAIPLKKFTPSMTTYHSSDQADLVLIKEAPELLSGHIVIPGNDRAYQIMGKCSDVPCTKWSALIYTERGEIGSLRLIESQGETVRVSVQTDSEENFDLQFTETISIPVQAQAYTNFHGRIDATTFDFGQDFLNQWFDTKIETWTDDAIAQLKSLQISEVSITDRSALNWAGWVDIGFMNQESASGMLSLTGPDGSISYPFLFDLKKGTVTPDDEQFKKGIKIQDVLSQKILESREALKTETEEGFDEWISETTFDYTYFRHDGMVLSSPFHPVYGQAEIVIGYDDLKPYLKRKSQISALIK